MQKLWASSVSNLSYCENINKGRACCNQFIASGSVFISLAKMGRQNRAGAKQKMAVGPGQNKWLAVIKLPISFKFSGNFKNQCICFRCIYYCKTKRILKLTIADLPRLFFAPARFCLSILPRLVFHTSKTRFFVQSSLDNKAKMVDLKMMNLFDIVEQQFAYERNLWNMQNTLVSIL